MYISQASYQLACERPSLGFHVMKQRPPVRFPLVVNPQEDWYRNEHKESDHYTE
jgi:hypothetical protein